MNRHEAVPGNRGAQDYYDYLSSVDLERPSSDQVGVQGQEFDINSLVEWDEPPTPEIEWDEPKKSKAGEYVGQIASKVKEALMSDVVQEGSFEKIPSVRRDIGVGIADYALAGASDLVSTVVGGLAGLGVLPFKGVDEAAEVIKSIQEKSPYKVKTKSGEKIQEVTGDIFNWWSNINAESDADAQYEIMDKADQLIKEGKLSPDKKEAFVETMYEPTRRAIQSGIWNFVPSLLGVRPKKQGMSRNVSEGEYIPGDREPTPPGDVYEGNTYESFVNRPKIGDTKRMGRDPLEGEYIPPDPSISRQYESLDRPDIEGSLYRDELPPPQGKIGQQNNIGRDPLTGELISQESLPQSRGRIGVDPIESTVQRDLLGESRRLGRPDRLKELRETVQGVQETRRIGSDRDRMIPIGRGFKEAENRLGYSQRMEKLFFERFGDQSQVKIADVADFIKDPTKDIHKNTKADIKESMEESIRVTGDSPKEWGQNLVNEIDQAIKYKPKGEFVTFDIEGDGVFKVKNTKEGLESFKKKVKDNPGFKNIQKPRKKSTKPPKAAKGAADEFLRDNDIPNAYNAMKASGSGFVVTKDGDKVGLARELESFTFKGNQFSVGKKYIRQKTKKGALGKMKPRYYVYDKESGVVIDGDGANKKQDAVKRAKDRINKAGDDKFKRALKEVRKGASEKERIQKLEDDYGLNNQTGRRGESYNRGFGNKQGGELKIGEIAEGIANTYRDVKGYFKKKTDAPASLIFDMNKAMFRAPANVIRDLNSPTAKMLADIMAKPRTNKTGVPVKADINERSQVMAGRFIHELDNILEPLRGRLGTIGKTKNDQVLNQLYSQSNLPVSPDDVLKAAADIRKWLDKVRDYVVRQGIDIGRVDNYFPRIWDANKIHSKPKDFAQFLVDNGKVDGQKIPYDMAERITQNIIHNDGYHDNGGFGYKDPQFSGKAEAPTSKHFLSRKIEIDDKKAMDWIEKDISAVLSKHAFTMANRGEYARSFGAKGEKLSKMVSDIEREYNLSRNTRLRVNEIEPLIRDWSNAYLGRYGTIQSNLGREVMRAASSFEVVTKLPMVALTAITELGPVTGLGKTKTPLAMVKVSANAFNNLARNADKLITGKTHLSKTELQETLENMGHYTIQAFNQAQASRFGGMGSKISAKAMQLNGHDFVTNFMRSLTHQVTMDIIRGNAKYLSKGKNNRASQDYRRQLIEMGIDPNEAVKWYQGGMKDNSFTAKAQIGAVGAVNRIIQRPNPSMTPLWTFSEKLSWLSLFKKFTLSFQNNYIAKMFSEVKDAKTFTGKTSMLMGALIGTGIAYLVMKAKHEVYWGGSENAPYRQGEDEQEQLLGDFVEAIDRAGYTGAFTFPLSVFRPRFGFWEGGEERIVNLMGPVATDMAKVIDIMIAQEDSPKKAADFITKNIPTQFYIGADILEGEGKGSSVKRKEAKESVKEFLDFGDSSASGWSGGSGF